jgi:hypothetical protein
MMDLSISTNSSLLGNLCFRLAAGRRDTMLSSAKMPYVLRDRMCPSASGQCLSPAHRFMSTYTEVPVLYAWRQGSELCHKHGPVFMTETAHVLDPEVHKRVKRGCCHRLKPELSV